MHYEIKYKISKFFSNLIYPFQALIGTIGRFCYWGWVLRNNHDWDYYNVYIMILLKLKRMRVSLKNGFIAEDEKEEILESLDQAIYHCQRLVNDNYCENIDKVTAKWGEMQLVTDLIDGNHRGRFFNTNAFTPEDQIKADKAMQIAYTKDDFQMKMDHIKLFDIIKSNLTKWWD